MTQLPDGLHGAFRRADLVQRLGLPTVRALLTSGRLVRYSRQVLLDRRHVADLRTQAAAALLLVGPKAALTGHTAALLHGCSAADAGAVHVLTDYRRQVPSRPGLVVHQGTIDEHDVIEVDGLRTVPLEHAIADLLCRADRSIALACADQALATHGPALRDRVADQIHARADPRGTRRAELLLDLACGQARSPAESRLLLVLLDARLPMPLRQHPVHDQRGRERYRLAFAWPESLVALEYDDDHPPDPARDADLASRGWTVIRAAPPDVRDPTWIIQALRIALGKPGRKLRVA